MNKPKSKNQSSVEFVVPYSLPESIYRILETKGQGSRYFVPFVEKITSDCYCFHLLSRRVTTRYSMLLYYEVRPILEIKGRLQALDETSTLVTAQLSLDWFAIFIFAGVLPIVFLVIASAFISAKIGLFVFVVLLLILLYAARLLYND